MSLKGLRTAALAVLIFFAGAEVVLRVGYFVRNSLVTEIPLPYLIGDEYGPLPPWLDRLRLLEPDATLIWRSRPNLHRRYLDMFTPARTEEERVALLRRFLPVVPPSFRGNPVWEISLNSEGFREGEFREEKPQATFRIVCLGDSWTFGTNVGAEQTYPQQLRAVLGREFPSASFEVLNLGVMGYSSYQGLELWKRRAADLAPDLVVIGFAMNDGRLAGYRDKDLAAGTARPGVAGRIRGVLDYLESYRLLRYLALVSRDKPQSVGERIRAEADSTTRDQRDVYAKFEPWTRVSPPDYRRNITALVDLARSRGAGVILLYNGLWGESLYHATLQAISREKGVPLVDSSALIAAARRRREKEREVRLALRPPPAPRARSDGQVEVVFRVYAGDRPVPTAIYLVGGHPKLGDLAPNTVRMYDDGTHGDQRARDGVWSYAATFAPGTHLFIVYTNSGAQGKWEGLDVPAVRHVVVDANDKGGTRYLPIDSFGAIDLQADAWHTNAVGYGLIAQALLDELKKSDPVRRYLGRGTAAPGAVPRRQ